MIDRLIELDCKNQKRIAVIGDALTDVWIHGHLANSQDGCPKFVEKSRLKTPGGAAGAVRQLENWNSFATLLSVKATDCWPIKTRFLDENNRIVFRHDVDTYGTAELVFPGYRTWHLESIKNGHFDAVLISDYDKGFLDPPTIRKIIDLCNERRIPVVADAKREPSVYKGAILKGNEAYRMRYHDTAIWDFAGLVFTRGNKLPTMHEHTGETTGDYVIPSWDARLPVECRNHIGAGDCFAAHLTLCLAHGIPLWAAGPIADAAGRIYVQHLHGRPPYPHEIRKDLDSVGGKRLHDGSAAALRRSVTGRIVITNGIFRLGAHAGHAWLLNWAKQQGDVLVVAINDDESTARLRPDEFCLPLEERCAILAGFSCVDWVIPFSEPDPCDIIRQLKPNLLIKGSEYVNDKVPGDDLVETRFAPESPYASHCSDLVNAVKGG